MLARVLRFLVVICVTSASIAIAPSDALAQNAAPGSAPNAAPAEPSKFKAFVDYLAPLRWSLGASVNWNAAAGYGMNVEVVNLGEGLTDAALYCAPMGVLATDVGMAAMVNIIKPMGYYMPEDYTGYAVAFGLSLPFKLGAVQYSFGANFSDALDRLEKQKQYGEFEPEQIPEELTRFIAGLAGSKLSAVQQARVRTIACQMGGLLLKDKLPVQCQNPGVVSFNPDPVPNISQMGPAEASKLDEWITGDYTAMFKTLKSVSEKNVFAQTAPNLNKLVRAVVETMADCGSIAISFGVGWSMLPVSVAAQFSHYTLMVKKTAAERPNLLKSLNRRALAAIWDEDVKNMKIVFEQMAHLCPDSRRWLGRDTDRLVNLMSKPLAQPKSTKDYDKYFTSDAAEALRSRP